MQGFILTAIKPLYMAFLDLEKAFDRVPRDVIWWAMRKLGIDEWLVRLVQSMYKDVRSRVRVGDGYSEEFGVGVGVHQGSVLSPLLFIIVLEALSREFRTGCPWELLYADNLMISAGSNVGYFGHGRFGHGHFGQDISATDISAIKNAKGGRFGQNRNVRGRNVLAETSVAEMSVAEMSEHRWVHGGAAGKGEDLEDRDGEKWPTCEHGENKDNGVWY